MLPAEAVATPSPSPEPSAEVAPGLPVVGVIEAFEAGTDGWHGDTGSPDSSVGCVADSGLAHDGRGSMRFEYRIGGNDWVTCGYYYDQTRDWSGGGGLSLWLQADPEAVGEEVTLMVFSGPIEGPTPFELSFTTEPGCDRHWTELTFAWSDFEVAEWAAPGGLGTLDPRTITGYGFSVGAWQGVEKVASLWLDGIGLTGVPQ